MRLNSTIRKRSQERKPAVPPGHTNKQQGKRGSRIPEPRRKGKRALTTLIVQAGIARSVREAQAKFIAGEICYGTSGQIKHGKPIEHAIGVPVERLFGIGGFFVDKDTVVIHRDKCPECSKHPRVRKPAKYDPLGFKAGDLEERRKIAQEEFDLAGSAGWKRNRTIPIDLDYHSIHAVEAWEMDVAERLTATLPLPADQQLHDDANQARLLPHAVMNHLDIAYFLCRMVLPARAAERITGVPCSILLAEAIQCCNTDLQTESENDFFGTGLRFASAAACFLEHAIRLVTDKAFEPVWLAADDPAEYLHELRRCEFWNRDTRRNMFHTIVSYDLRECDGFTC